MWHVILCLEEKQALQIEHWWGFFPSWTVATCDFIFCLRAKLAPHNSHMCGFFPSWTDVWCIVKDPFVYKKVMRLRLETTNSTFHEFLDQLKVSKFQKQIFLLSFKPKNERKYFLNSALACKMSQIKKWRHFIILIRRHLIQ